WVVGERASPLLLATGVQRMWVRSLPGPLRGALGPVVWLYGRPGLQAWLPRLELPAAAADVPTGLLLSHTIFATRPAVAFDPEVQVVGLAAEVCAAMKVAQVCEQLPDLGLCSFELRTQVQPALHCVLWRLVARGAAHAAAQLSRAFQVWSPTHAREAALLLHAAVQDAVVHSRKAPQQQQL
ncbi:MAG: hypothetical protein ACK4MS_16435, partial [Paracoccaceae bacterium]